MNDFLKQLRSGGGKRFDKNRRPYDGTQFRGNDRQNIRDKKGPMQRKNYDQGQLQTIKKILETIADGQKTLGDLTERQVLATERIAHALEAMNRIPGDNTVEPASAAAVVPHDARTAPGTTVPDESPDREETVDPDQTVKTDGRDIALAIIARKRDEGEAFDKIAEYLEEKQVPTLSGKGKWRAQSVSRLFNKQA